MKIGKSYILYIDDKKSKDYAALCEKSCIDHGVTYEMHMGYMGLTIEDLIAKTGWKMGRPGIEDSDRQYVKEYNTSLGHVDIWRKIAESNCAGVILEHDAVVVKNYEGLEVEDGKILHLGPRIDREEDFEFPDIDVEYIDIRRHEGAHAYAMTPNTAKFLLKTIEAEQRLLPPEAYISVRNPYELSFLEIDPPHVLCVMGNRVSYTSHRGVTDKQNFKHHPGFLKGLKNPDVMSSYRLMDYRFSSPRPAGEPLSKILSTCGIKTDDELKILVIGSYEGRSSVWFVENMLRHPGSEIYCVDNFSKLSQIESSPNSSAEVVFNFNMSVSPHPEKVRLLKKDSRIVMPMMCHDRLSFDIIYVDGSSATLDVINDGTYALHLLKPKGVVIFGPSSLEDGSSVKRAVDILSSLYPKYMNQIYSEEYRAYQRSK